MDNDVQDMIEDVEENGLQYKGKTHFLKFLKGETLTLKPAILAMCYACNSMGRESDDCGVMVCPLHPHSQFLNRGKKEVKVDENGEAVKGKRGRPKKS